MAGQPEGLLVRAIAAAILSEHPGSWVFKVHGNPYQSAGVPDLLACVEGRFVALEVKAQRNGESLAHAVGRTTLRQWQELRKITLAGGTSAVVVSAAEALEVVRCALAGEPWASGYAIPFGPDEGTDTNVREDRQP